MYNTNKRTDFLFARPSFLSGVAKVLDLFGTFTRYNSSTTPDEADSRAIAADWGVVGQDLQTGFVQLETDAQLRRER